MKMVVRDYMAAFRPSKIGERYAPNIFWLCYIGIHILVVTPMQFWNKNYGARIMIAYYILACLALFSMYSSYLHPIGLSKLLFLSPMSEQERRKYLTESYLFKIGLVAGINILGLTVVCVAGKLSLIYIIMFLFTNMGTAISFSLINDKRIQKYREKKQYVGMGFGADGWETAAMLISAFAAYVLLLRVENPDETRGMQGIIEMVIMLVIELPFVIKMLKRVRPTIERAINYEN